MLKVRKQQDTNDINNLNIDHAKKKCQEKYCRETFKLFRILVFDDQRKYVFFCFFSTSLGFKFFNDFISLS